MGGVAGVRVGVGVGVGAGGAVGLARAGLRGVNTLRFQIASQPSTAISTLRPTPAVPGPCGSSPGDPAVPQELIN